MFDVKNNENFITLEDYIKGFNKINTDILVGYVLEIKRLESERDFSKLDCLNLNFNNIYVNKNEPFRVLVDINNSDNANNGDFYLKFSSSLTHFLRHVDIDDIAALQLSYSFFVASAKDEYEISDLCHIIDKSKFAIKRYENFKYNLAQKLDKYIETYDFYNYMDEDLGDIELNIDAVNFSLTNNPNDIRNDLFWFKATEFKNDDNFKEMVEKCEELLCDVEKVAAFYNVSNTYKLVDEIKANLNSNNQVLINSDNKSKTKEILR